MTNRHRRPGPWRWRTSNGNLILPKDMETSHLFNSLRTVWNSTMPRHLHITGGHKWYFNPENYSLGYLSMAIREFLNELETRTDRTNFMEQSEAFIRANLNNKEKP